MSCTNTSVCKHHWSDIVLISSELRSLITQMDRSKPAASGDPRSGWGFREWAAFMAMIRSCFLVGRQNPRVWGDRWLGGGRCRHTRHRKELPVCSFAFFLHGGHRGWEWPQQMITASSDLSGCLLAAGKEKRNSGRQAGNSRSAVPKFRGEQKLVNLKPSCW